MFDRTRVGTMKDSSLWLLDFCNLRDAKQLTRTRNSLTSNKKNMNRHETKSSNEIGNGTIFPS